MRHSDKDVREIQEWFRKALVEGKASISMDTVKKQIGPSLDVADWRGVMGSAANEEGAR